MDADRHSDSARTAPFFSLSFYLGFKVEFSLGMCVVSFRGRGTVFFFRNIGYSK